MLYSIRYLLAVDQYTQVAPLLAMGDVIMFSQFLYMKYEHFTYPVLPDSVLSFSDLFCSKGLQALLDLCFVIVTLKVQQSQSIWIHSQTGTLPHFVWFANSHESVGMLHDQVYLENGLKPFYNGLTIIFLLAMTPNILCLAM